MYCYHNFNVHVFSEINPEYWRLLSNNMVDNQRYFDFDIYCLYSQDVFQNY